MNEKWQTLKHWLVLPKTRSWLMTLMMHLTIVASVGFASPTDFSLLLGGAVSLVGWLLWGVAMGYGDNSAAEPYGIYRHVRHPKVMGINLMVLGVALSSRCVWPYLAFMLVGTLWVKLLLTHKDQDALAQQRHDYKHYKRVVDGFFPSLWPYPYATEDRSFSPLGVILSHRKIIIKILITLGCVNLMLFALMQIEGEWYISALAAVFYGGLILVNMIVSGRKYRGFDPHF